MLWFFHSRVFPRPGNRTGDQAIEIFLILSEQESCFKSNCWVRSLLSRLFVDMWPFHLWPLRSQFSRKFPLNWLFSSSSLYSRFCRGSRSTQFGHKKSSSQPSTKTFTLCPHVLSQTSHSMKICFMAPRPQVSRYRASAFYRPLQFQALNRFF